MINTLNLPTTSQMTREFRSILDSFKNRILDKIFDIEICKVSCKYDNCILDFRNKPLPTETKEFKSFRLLSKEEKQTIFEKNRVFFDIHIESFLASVEKVKNKNYRNKETLQYWLSLNIPQDCRKKIENILDTYSTDINQPDWQTI